MKERAAILLKVRDALLQDKENIATILTRENVRKEGKRKEGVSMCACVSADKGNDSE